MKLTPEQLRQTADAIEAAKQGKPVQYQATNDEWFDCESPVRLWNLNGDKDYRPKPEPKTRPWSKKEDFPIALCVWLVEKSRECAECLVTSVSDHGITYIVGSLIQFLEWSESNRWERLLYSTDRKTWHKCEVTEEA